MRIQLRVRTEYSMGVAFGPLDLVVARLKATGCAAAGMVEAKGGTWGHVSWNKALRKAEIAPLFGAEIVVPRGELLPTAWVLAEDVSALYKLTTAAHRTKVNGRPTQTAEQLAAARGVVRFAGGALTDPECFDYIDLNPGAPRSQLAAVRLHQRTGKPLVITSDNAYPAPTDKDAFLLLDGREKVTPQHLLTEEELVAAFPVLDARQRTSALAAAEEVFERCRAAELKAAPLIKIQGDLWSMIQHGKQKRLARGHIAEWTPEYEQRLQREWQLIRDKQFESYFLIVADMVQWAKQRMLVGPARGSAAGSLASYLLEITEVDPLPFGLIFERFIDVTRRDLPDIDLDFPDAQRDQVYEYLAAKYGDECVARIGTINTLKPKSALGVAAKKMDIPPWVTKPVKNAMFVRSSGDSRANSCLIDTLRETEPGRDLLGKHPELEIAGAIEGHASHTGVHAAGVCVCNDPVWNYCTVDGGIMHLDKYDAEALNLLKIDALGLRTLGVIEDAGVVMRDQLYDLKLDDPAVFTLLSERKYAGVFQWEGRVLQTLTQQLTLRSFADMEQITALARPGPLGGGTASRYIARHAGQETWEYAHPSMAEYLDETYGLVLYQEQVLRIGREIGGLSWDDVTLLRKAMSKSYGKEYFDQFGERFVEGAARLHNIPNAAAWGIWNTINSMGSWAFNKSHAVSYALVSYWTAWIKAHHPLEYAAATLRNAKDDDSVVDVLRELVKEGVKYLAFDVERSGVTWSAVDGVLVGGFTNLVGIGPAKAHALVERRDAGKLTDKDREKFAATRVKFTDLNPIHSRFGDIYHNPEAHGVRPGSKVLQLTELPEGGEVVVIGLVKEKDKRDENEVVRVKNRGGRTVKGQSLFADLAIVDDSTNTPTVARIDRFLWDTYGRLAIERIAEGEDIVMVRGKKIPNYPMIKVTRIKCLTRPEVFNEKG